VNVRIEGRSKIHGGETVFLTPDPASIHLFDEKGRPIAG